MPSWDGAMDNVKEGIRAKQRLRDRQLSMSGAPDFESMPYEDQAPRGTTPMSSAAPMTRTISQIPQGETEQSVRDAIKSKMRSRSQIIQRALTTQDPNERAALIQARYGLEDELKPLGATLPKTFVTPEGAQASRDSLRQKLAVDLAKQRAAESAPQPQVDPALAAGTAMAPYSMRVPSKDPQNEIMRQQMLRIKAGEPMLTGTGSDMEVTTPDIMEMRRRRAVQERLAEAQRGSPTEIADKAFPAGPVDAGAINRRFAEQADMQGNAAPEATRIMQARVNQKKFEQEMAGKGMDLVRTNADADIAQAKARASGQDTASLVAKGQAAVARREADAQTNYTSDALGKGYFQTIAQSADEARRGNTAAQQNFAEALKNLHDNWDQMSEMTKAEMTAQLEQIANQIGASEYQRTKNTDNALAYAGGMFGPLLAIPWIARQFGAARTSSGENAASDQVKKLRMLAQRRRLSPPLP